MTPLQSWITVVVVLLGLCVWTLLMAWLIDVVARQRYKPRHRRTHIELPEERND